MNDKSEGPNTIDDGASAAPPIPVWLRATPHDAQQVEIEAPLKESTEADCAAFSDIYRVAANAPSDQGSEQDTARARVFVMLSSVTGMYFKPQERQEPFGPMMVMADGRRTATIFDDVSQTQQDRTISSLFEQMRPELDGIFGGSITTDIERSFLRKPGPNLRNALSHGLLDDGDPFGPDAIYGCWLIFRLCLLPLIPCRKELAEWLEGSDLMLEQKAHVA